MEFKMCIRDRQYFVTLGIVGIIAYLNLLISSLVRMIRRSGGNPAVMAIVYSVISYSAQAVVNLSLIHIS